MASNRDPTCPACAAAGAEVIYTVPDIPAHSCILLRSVDEARTFPRRALELAFCRECGFAFNSIFDREVMRYSTNFEESQHFSGTFSGFARELAAEIARKCRTPGKRVLEIGCGKGEFLLELCRLGGCTGVGIDPGYREDRLEQDERVSFRREFFGPQHRALDADLILCRHTLEHIPDVLPFIASIREMIGERRTQVMFETPDAARVLAEGAFWDIYYEHCSYFSAGAHARLFRRCGFGIDDLYLAYNGQYIIQYARPGNGRTAGRLPVEDDLETLRRLAAGFPARVATVQEKWRSLVRQRAAGGERIVLWGGGSKAVSFLTTLGLVGEVDRVVDVNPFKQGKFIPGTGHPVVAPEALREHPPGLVIAMNPIYVNEIRGALHALGLEPEITAL
jgi:SAM-dependent methyltransferase